MSALLCSVAGRSWVATKRSGTAPHHTIKLRFRCPYCKHEGTRVHPEQYESTTMKSTEAVIRPVAEPVRRPNVPTHTDTLATSYSGKDIYCSLVQPKEAKPGGEPCTRCESDASSGVSGDSRLRPDGNEEEFGEIRRTWSVPIHIQKAAAKRGDWAKAGVSIGEEQSPLSSVVYTPSPPPRKV